MDNILLVDGDIIVYRVGFSSDEVEWDICKARVDKMLTDILTNTDSMVMYGYITTGANNFRNKVATTAPYKGNRPATKPVHYKAIREYLVDYHGFQNECEQEADDAIGIANAELNNWKLSLPGEDKVIIASIDKDLLMLPGYHYNIRSGALSSFTVKEAKHRYYVSVLTGDRVDNIVGLRGIGPVKANKILKDPYGYIRDCRQAYQEFDDAVTDVLAEAHMVENMELLWIKQQDNIEFDTCTPLNTYSKWG